jgi:hypothetical protein
VLARHERDVLVAGGRPSLLEGVLEAVGDEGEGRPALLGERLARLVREHEHGMWKGGVLAPGLLAERERPPAHDVCAGRLDRLRDDIAARTGLVARQAVLRSPGVEVVEPLVEAIEVVVRAGDEAVQGHRLVEQGPRP